ncbi:MAG: ABC transporter permease subunit, partial [Microbacteriaceae bacterium]|nr:ABC transporter permease subunit [Microbacteriaceae bacterium]
MKKTLAAFGFALGLPVILVALWWFSTIVSPNFFVPTPPELIATFVETWFGPRIWIDLLPSVGRFIAGVAIAIVLGILIGIVVGLNPSLRAFTEPVFEFFRALPPPVLIPVLLLLFGITDWVNIGIIVLAAIWPVVLNTVEGVRAADSVQSDTSRSYGINGFARVRHQVLPSASPQIFAGVRQALPIGLM